MEPGLLNISIHALLAESDFARAGRFKIVYNFYPRSPCGERPWARGSRVTYVEFLSTLSLRRATFGLLCRILFRRYFYPRSPCGERRYSSASSWLRIYFYPRSPCGERLRQILRTVFEMLISIHALLAESDLAGPSGPAFLYNFYPRSPCGERPQAIYPSSTPPKFLSTLSLRRATRYFAYYIRRFSISIHALLAESDGRNGHNVNREHQFLSTLSLRRATI